MQSLLWSTLVRQPDVCCRLCLVWLPGKGAMSACVPGEPAFRQSGHLRNWASGSRRGGGCLPWETKFMKLALQEKLRPDKKQTNKKRPQKFTPRAYATEVQPQLQSSRPFLHVPTQGQTGRATLQDMGTSGTIRNLSPLCSKPQACVLPPNPGLQQPWVQTVIWGTGLMKWLSAPPPHSIMLCDKGGGSHNGSMKVKLGTCSCVGKTCSDLYLRAPGTIEVKRVRNLKYEKGPTHTYTNSFELGVTAGFWTKHHPLAVYVAARGGGGLMCLILPTH